MRLGLAMLKSAILAMFEFSYMVVQRSAAQIFISAVEFNLFLANNNLVYSKPVELSVIKLC